VLERDVRQDDYPRAEHVRRVQPPAEPGLDHRDVHARGRESEQRRSGQHLELRRADPLRRGTHRLDRRLEIRLAPVHPDPLGPPGHVRREIRPDA
jgi:hypothetical protein